MFNFLLKKSLLFVAFFIGTYALGSELKVKVEGSKQLLAVFSEAELQRVPESHLIDTLIAYEKESLKSFSFDDGNIFERGELVAIHRVGSTKAALYSRYHWGIILGKYQSGESKGKYRVQFTKVPKFLVFDPVKREYTQETEHGTKALEPKDIGKQRKLLVQKKEVTPTDVKAVQEIASDWQKLFSIQELTNPNFKVLDTEVGRDFGKFEFNETNSFQRGDIVIAPRSGGIWKYAMVLGKKPDSEEYVVQVAQNSTKPIPTKHIGKHNQKLEILAQIKAHLVGYMNVSPKVTELNQQLKDLVKKLLPTLSVGQQTQLKALSEALTDANYRYQVRAISQFINKL